ncbi:hypothetical protein IQ225_01360 [Synechocystis salina LEGE 06155]|nr:hypothetical protein [Synechocystis salina LEGE 06155]
MSHTFDRQIMNDPEQLHLFDLSPYLAKSRFKKNKLRRTSVIIELQCSTRRAANLMQISTSTLNRAKSMGKLPYRQGFWTAELSRKQGNKRLFWKVTFNR